MAQLKNVHSIAIFVLLQCFVVFEVQLSILFVVDILGREAKISSQQCKCREIDFTFCW